MKYQDWQRDSRDECLSAESDDAPAWLRENQRPRSTPLHRLANLFGVLALFALSFYLLAEHSEFGDLLKARIHGIAPGIALPSIDLNAPPPRQAAAPYPIAQQVESIQPDTLASRPISNPQPLADCIKSANLIDENVVACRYGTLPRDHRPPPSSGMVSAQYLADYKADQANQANSSAPARRSANREVDQAWIERWDGGGSYFAEWHALDNRIDSSSVCLNHRRGSIDYRECRKAAKVHFREQCRAWEKRWARDRQDWSKQMEQRYCSAANGFSPMG